MERKWTSEDAYVNPITQALDICLFNPPNRTVCKSPSIQHPWKKTLTSWAQQDSLEETIAFENKRKSLLVIQIKLKDLKPLFSRKASLTFQKRSNQRKCSCFGGQILPTRINNNHWKLIYVSPTIPSSQYETNLWSTHVNIVGLIRRRFSKSRGLSESVSFLPLPLPLPLPPLSFFGSCFISHAANTENPVFLGLPLLRNQTETLATQAITNPLSSLSDTGSALKCLLQFFFHSFVVFHQQRRVEINRNWDIQNTNTKRVPKAWPSYVWNCWIFSLNLYR